MGERLLCKQEVAGSIPAGSMGTTCSWAQYPNPLAPPPRLMSGAQTAFWMAMRLRLACSGLGTRTVRTPCVSVACASSVSLIPGRLTR